MLFGITFGSLCPGLVQHKVKWEFCWGWVSGGDREEAGNGWQPVLPRIQHDTGFLEGPLLTSGSFVQYGSPPAGRDGRGYTCSLLFNHAILWHVKIKAIVRPNSSKHRTFFNKHMQNFSFSRLINSRKPISGLRYSSRFRPGKMHQCPVGRTCQPYRCVRWPRPPRKWVTQDDGALDLKGYCGGIRLLGSPILIPRLCQGRSPVEF